MHTRPLLLALAFVGLVPALAAADGTPPPGTDDSTWINQEILAAIQRGDNQYVLPAGNFYLEHPLVIPAGTHDFALKGAGSTQTFLKTPNVVMKQAIQVGIQVVLWNNWWLTGSGNVPVDNVRTGDYTVTISGKPASFNLGYYVIWDDYKIVCAKGPNVVMNHAELLKVTGYDPTTGRATIDVPAGREYSYNPKLCPFNDKACRNITVSGFGFDGLSSLGASDGLVALGVTDGGVLSDLAIVNFRSDCVMTNTARNVLIDHVSLSGGNLGGAGTGYGVAVYRSRFVTVQDSSATQARHGFMLHSGAMDVVFQRCTTTCGFDTHGYDERRVQILNCTGDGGDIGNDAWLGGARDVVIRYCTFTDQFGFHANVRNVRVQDSQVGGIGFYSVEPGTTPTVGVPAGGLADVLLFERTTIKGKGVTLLWESGANRVGGVTFSKCAFENTSTDWGTCIDLDHIAGTFYLVDCTLKVNSPDHVVQLTDPAKRFLFTMTRCKLSGTGRLGIWISSIFGGQATFLSNVYTAIGAFSSTFLQDDTKRQRSVGNIAVKA